MVLETNFDRLSVTGEPRGAASARGGPEPGLDTVAPRLRVHLRVQTLQGVLWRQGEQHKTLFEIGVAYRISLILLQAKIEPHMKFEFFFPSQCDIYIYVMN